MLYTFDFLFFGLILPFSGLDSKVRIDAQYLNSLEFDNKTKSFFFGSDPFFYVLRQTLVRNLTEVQAKKISW
jgi:hypothetical protein